MGGDQSTALERKADLRGRRFRARIDRAPCQRRSRGLGKTRASHRQEGEHNIHYAKCCIGAVVAFVGSAWQWLGLWLGSCLRPQSPAKDEIAA
ncbi:hypothetical protein DUW70_12555 [Stenotrophomonas maltophilia]|nr:hypothetical protein DUW70_12555 [Stenotrophomonas maltophilia]